MNITPLLMLALIPGFFLGWQSSPMQVQDFSLASGPLVVGLPQWDGRDVTLVSGQPSVNIPLRQLPTTYYTTSKKSACGHGNSCDFRNSRVCIIDLDRDIACRGTCR